MNYKMLEYNRIDISEGITVDETNKLKDCMLCHYCYILDKNFSYGPNLWDACYNIMRKSMDSKNIAIAHVRESAYRIYFLGMTRREAKQSVNNTNLIDKKGIL